MPGMSRPPPPARQHTPQSPPHPHASPPLAPPPRPRAAPYRGYYRGAPGPSASTPVLGWTPRTPAAPHTPVPRGGHAGRGAAAAARVSPALHSPALPVQPQGSPRVGPSPPAAKPGVGKPAVPLPISSPLLSGAQTPTWLKGGYQHRQATPSTPQPTTVESWCKDRIEAIKATVECRSDAVPELRKVMDDLDSTKVLDEIALVGSIRKECWKARERQRKAVLELRRAEREVQRIGAHSAHINGKIARLRSYARFIEGGWKDESALENHIKDAEGTDGHKDDGSHKTKEGEHRPNENSNGKRENAEPSRSFDEGSERPRRRSSDAEIYSF